MSAPRKRDVLRHYARREMWGWIIVTGNGVRINHQSWGEEGWMLFKSRASAERWYRAFNDDKSLRLRDWDKP